MDLFWSQSGPIGFFYFFSNIWTWSGLVRFFKEKLFSVRIGSVLDFPFFWLVLDGHIWQTGQFWEPMTLQMFTEPSESLQEMCQEMSKLQLYKGNKMAISRSLGVIKGSLGTIKNELWVEDDRYQFGLSYFDRLSIFKLFMTYYMTTPEEVIYKELWKIIWTKIFWIPTNRLWNWFYDLNDYQRWVHD